MSHLDKSYPYHRDVGSNPQNKQTNSNNNNKPVNAGFNQTIPSLPFQLQAYDILPQHINKQSSSPTSIGIEGKKYKSVSEMNSPRSQVRFSIPIADTSGCDDSNVSMSTSPSKIVFPRDCSDDSISESSITPSITNSVHSNKSNGVVSTETLERAAIEGYLVNMQSKIMVNVPEEIWSFHNEKRQTNNNKLHKRAQSMQDLSFDRDMEVQENPVYPNRGHHKSRSLQLLISQTVAEYNNTASNDTVSMNDSQVSHVSPLNFPSFNSSNPGLRTPNKATNLYLTSDSPINKHKVPIPLETALPPFLSPSNKNKKRNSLIYDGESYSVFNEDASSESASELVSESTGEIVHDSILSNSSIASITYNISFDANAVNLDELLGIDNDANVNLKEQFKNLKRQKADINNTKSPHKSIDIKNLPPVPHISTKPVVQNNTDTQMDEKIDNAMVTPVKSPGRNVQPHSILKVTKSPNYSADLDASLALTNNIQPPSNFNSPTYSNIQSSRSSMLSNVNSNRSSKYLSPNHARLSKMLDEYNAPANKLCLFNKATPSGKQSQKNSMVSPRAPSNPSTTKNNNDSLAILATPSKSIVIPDLDNVLKTPDNISPSFTSTNTSNGTLKFFDQFEPLHPTNNDVSPITTNSTRQGQLDTAFKFPQTRESLSFPISHNVSNNKYVPQNDTDYQKTPQSSAKLEERRQKLLASHLSPNNRIGHAHRRSRSIHNIDFMSPQKLMEESLPPTPSLPFDATSTPPPSKPIAPRRSSLRAKSPSITPQKEEQVNTATSPLNYHTKQPSVSQTAPAIKPLSSFQSFSTPIKKMNLVPNIKIDGASEQRKAYNLLSPRRQLSNSGSHQSSSTNSQFSKNSRVTQLTESTEISVNNPISEQVKPHFPINDIHDNSDDFKIVKERQKDGHVVDVIVLDDDDSLDNQQPTGGKFSKNSRVLEDRTNKKSPRKRSPNKSKSPFKKRYNSDTKEEQLENYKQLLSMCENTAAIAKETIYELAGANTSSNPNNDRQHC